MNSAKQYVNSEPMWDYCSRAGKKKKKAENVDAAKRSMQTVTKRAPHFTTFNPLVSNVILIKLDLLSITPVPNSFQNEEG